MLHVLTFDILRQIKVQQANLVVGFLELTAELLQYLTSELKIKIDHEII